MRIIISGKSATDIFGVFKRGGIVKMAAAALTVEAFVTDIYSLVIFMRDVYCGNRGAGTAADVVIQGRAAVRCVAVVVAAVLVDEAINRRMIRESARSRQAICDPVQPNESQ